MRGRPEPLLTPREMEEADRRAATLGMPGSSLMRRAAWAVAQAALRFGPARTLVLCGPGGNGGDGWGAARLLAERGWPVAVAEWEAPRAGTDAAALRTDWLEGRGTVVPFVVEEAARAGLVIDAVFGAGVHELFPEKVAAVLRAATRVLAVDVPSGVSGKTGQAFVAEGERLRAAEATVTFVARKPGHLLLPGRELCGMIELADIGMPMGALPAVQAWRNTPALWVVPRVGAESHKYIRGHVTVLGGAEMTGAARLVAAGARRGGAGLVTIATGMGERSRRQVGNLYRGGDPGVIVSDGALVELLDDGRRRVWVCGPGLGRAASRAAMPLLLGAGRQVVADADALGVQPEALRGTTVLTPHAGEFAKLFGPLGADKVSAVRAAAALVGAVVVLKGADTVIAAPDGRAAINDNAPPWLATAGAGDVLAGLVAAHLAVGMEAWEAACRAVYVHGAAALRAGPGMVAEDLVAALRG